jgi:flagellar protein FlaG
MNEVRPVQTAAIVAASPVSAAGTVAPKTQVSGKELPGNVSQKDTQQASQASTVSDKTLALELKKVNDYVQSVQRDLQFSVDKESDRTIIKVVDSDSGDIIRQIPEDIFLELARRLKQDGEVNLLNAFG